MGIFILGMVPLILFSFIMFNQSLHQMYSMIFTIRVINILLIYLKSKFRLTKKLVLFGSMKSLWKWWNMNFWGFFGFFLFFLFFWKKLISFLTLFRIGLFGAAYGWERSQKAPSPSLKSVTHILQWWKLVQLYLT